MDGTLPASPLSLWVKNVGRAICQGGKNRRWPPRCRPPSLPPALARAEAERASGGWRQRRCQRPPPPPHRLAMHLGLFCWLATSASLGPSSLSPIHPALFVYNLNVVFVCCRSLLPAKKSLSPSRSPSLTLNRTKALPALPPTPPPPFQTKRQIFPPNAVSHSMDGHLFFLAGRCDAPTSNFGENNLSKAGSFFSADVCVVVITFNRHDDNLRHHLHHEMSKKNVNLEIPQKAHGSFCATGSRSGYLGICVIVRRKCSMNPSFYEAPATASR